MNVRVLFFASLREAVGVAQVDVVLAGADFKALRRALTDALGSRADALWEENVRLSRNQQLLETPATLTVAEGDELAFLPPVTGG